MTSVTFETGTISDAVRRAAKIAPGKAGHAFDKANGILFEINPAAEVQCLIRTTNLDAFHSEIIGTVSADGDPVRWRLPSQLLAQVVGSLPLKSGSQVTFTQEKRRVTVKQDRMKATMGLIDDDAYPDWEMFDGSSLTTVSALGGRVAMVEWAATNDGTPPLCGVYLDGEYAYATDRYRLARVPCKLDLAKPIVIPAGILGQCLKSMGDTGMQANEHQLLLAPDAYTQLKTVIYDIQYFPVKMMFDTTQYETHVEINKVDLLEKLNQANSYVGAERNPTVRTFWGRGEIAVMMENQEMGLFGNVVELPGQLDHARVEIKFSPKNLMDALVHAPENKVTIHYDNLTTDPRVSKNVKVTGGAGYECIVMKRAATQPTP